MKRIAVAALVVAAVCGMTVAGGADNSVEQTPTTEAWYQPNPTCPAPLGCLAPIPVPLPNPYPEGTMHVGYSLGNETARSYLRFPVAGVSGPLTAASLTIPLSTSPADGATAPMLAAVQVCLAFGPFERTEASYDAPPSVDCLTSAPMTYVATPTPRLQANLKDLLGDLTAASGLALIPDATKVKQRDTWRVVFSAHDRADAARTAPASLSITLGTGATLEPPADLPVDEPLVFDVFLAPPLAPEFADPAPTTPALDPPLAAGPGRQPATPVVFLRGYPYKAAWLMPLVLLALFAAILTAMSKDLTPRRARLRDRAD